LDKNEDKKSLVIDHAHLFDFVLLLDMATLKQAAAQQILTYPYIGII
jgi:hypothetical protein